MQVKNVKSLMLAGLMAISVPASTLSISPLTYAQDTRPLSWLTNQSKRDFKIGISLSDEDIIRILENILNSGLYEYNQGNFEAAIRSFEYVLDGSNAYPLAQAKALDYAGKAYSELGHYKKAIELHQQVLFIFTTLKNQEGKLNAITNLGNAHYSLGEYAKAIEFYQLASIFYGSISDRDKQAQVLVDLGNAYLSLGQDSKATQFLEQALSIFRNLEAKDQQIKTLINLGNIYTSRDDSEKSSELYQQALDSAKDIIEVVSEDLTTSFDRCHLSSRQAFDIEQKWNQLGFSILQICNSNWRYSLAISLGDTYFFTGQYEQAIKLYENPFFRHILCRTLQMQKHY
jgi:tetratricopeptide (TPR) repeat protein